MKDLLNITSIYIEPTENELQDFINSFDSNYAEYEKIIPELRAIHNFEQHNPYHCYNLYEHTMMALKSLPHDSDLITVLAMLFHDIGKPNCFFMDEFGVGHAYGHGKCGSDITKGILNRLGYCDYIVDKVCELIRYHDHTFDVSYKYIRKLVNSIGVSQMNRLLRIREADIIAQSPEFLGKRKIKLEKIKDIYHHIITEQKDDIQLVIDGNDLIEMGISQGPIIGLIKDELKKGIREGVINNNRDELISAAYQIYIVGVRD